MGSGFCLPIEERGPSPLQDNHLGPQCWKEGHFRQHPLVQSPNPMVGGSVRAALPTVNVRSGIRKPQHGTNWHKPLFSSPLSPVSD